jgi:hypothetical protein
MDSKEKKQLKNQTYYANNKDKVLAKAKERYEKTKTTTRPRGRPAGIKFPNGYKKHPLIILDKPADEYVEEQKKRFTGAYKSPEANDVIYEADGSLSYPPADSNK